MSEEFDEQSPVGPDAFLTAMQFIEVASNPSRYKKLLREHERLTAQIAEAETRLAAATAEAEAIVAKARAEAQKLDAQGREFWLEASRRLEAIQERERDVGIKERFYGQNPSEVGFVQAAEPEVATEFGADIGTAATDNLGHELPPGMSRDMRFKGKSNKGVSAS